MYRYVRMSWQFSLRSYAPLIEPTCAAVAYHPESDGRPLHVVVEINCKNGIITE